MAILLAAFAARALAAFGGLASLAALDPVRAVARDAEGAVVALANGEVLSRTRYPEPEETLP